MCRNCVSSLPVCAVVVVVLSAAASAQTSPAGGMFDIPLRGDIRAAFAATGDRVSPDRSQFLLELIRRLNRRLVSRHDRRYRVAPSLILARSDSPNSRNPSTSSLSNAVDTLPLPLAPEMWINVVFKGHATTETLAGAIVDSPDASLLYCALLALDDETREWLNARPDLVSLLAQHSAAFLVAAPGVRVANGRMQLPGADAADPAWQAIVGEPATEPTRFIEELVSRREGRVAYFLGTVSTLTPAQARLALALDDPDSASRLTAVKRLYAVFEHVASVWRIDQQPFWRPTLDPALLLSELETDEQGVPSLPLPNRGFWTAVFTDLPRDRRNGRASSDAVTRREESIDFAWLSEHVFAGPYTEHRRRYNTVLFVSRNLRDISSSAEQDATEAARAVGRYPALVAGLERAGLHDIAAFAAAARRADRLSAINDRTRAIRALAQFQGALALAARGAMRGSVDRNALSRLVSSLSAVAVSDDGDYEGRVVRWVVGFLSAPFDRRDDAVRRLVDSAGVPAAEAGLLRMLAGPPPGPELVDWEGTRYRVDLSRAEAMRLLGVLGGAPRPYVSVARALVAIGDGFGSETALIAADAVMARALTDLTYAAAFGQPDAASITASEAAGRHDFAVRPWMLPEPDYDQDRQWHMTGALLGLDVRLAQYSLLRTSLRPPPKRPTLDEADRRAFIEAVSLVDPRSLADGDRDLIVKAIDTGRARVAAMRTRTDAIATAEQAGLSATRRTLLAWALQHEPERAAQSFSLTELLWLGLGASPARANLNAWGAPAEPRLGCLCLRLFDARPWEVVAGRWDSGIRASTFDDLSLRLAELLSELQMPAVLLGPVLAAATVDLVDGADSRDPDDRRGLVDFVQRLSRERVEEYLALLTTDGPLVMVNDGPVPPPGVPRSHR